MQFCTNFGGKKINLSWCNIDSIFEPGEGLCLDLGCGYGRLRELIENKGYTWVGLDRGNFLLPNGFIQGDVHQLPFKDSSFKCVVGNCLLEHLENPFIAVQEINRVLEQWGVFCGASAFLEPYHGSYIHFSHKGLEKLFENNGFHTEILSPGASVFITLFHHLFPLHMHGGRKNKVGSFLGRLVGSCTLFAALTVSPFLASLLVNKDKVDKYKALLREMPERTAGHFLFRVKKVRQRDRSEFHY